MSKPAIVGRDLTVRFRPTVDRKPTLRRSLGRMRHREAVEVVALDGVTIEVVKGEAFGIVGRNGSGKSTLLKVVAKTLKPDGGTVNVYGRLSTLLALGVGFNPELSGRRNVYLGGLAAGLRRAAIDERFDDIVGYAELADAIDRPVKTYSSGMFSRLAFAVGMALDPDILLLDEVLAVGDEAFQRKSRASMEQMLDKAGTIVLVSHSLRNVVDFCDRVMWLDNGRVRTVGPAAEVVEAYRTAVAAATKPATRPGEQVYFTAHQKARAVMRVLSGEPIDVVAGELGCGEGRVEQWRRDFVGAGRERMKAGSGEAGAPTALPS